MDINGYFTLFTGVALLAIKPGPGMMTVATKAMGEGLPSAAAFMAGTMLAKIVFFTGIAFGYAFLQDTPDFLLALLKSITATYLIWLGVKGFQRFDPEVQAHKQLLKKMNYIQNLIAGFMLTISNPFDIVFFMGILPTILTVGSISVFEYIACSVTIVSAYSMVAFSYAIPIALSRQFFIRPLVRKLNTVSSAGLILVGLYIGYSTLTTVF